MPGGGPRRRLRPVRRRRLWAVGSGVGDAWPVHPSESGEATALVREIAGLRRENARLRKLLRLTGQEAGPAKPMQTALFDRAPGPVDAGSLPADKIAFFMALFGARTDVYAMRWEWRPLSQVPSGATPVVFDCQPG